jgi:hypothetical protein
MAEEPLVFISDKLSSDIGHLQTKPRHREGYGVWVTQNSPAKWKKRPLNFQELEHRRSGGDTTLVLCQKERVIASQKPMRPVGWELSVRDHTMGHVRSARIQVQKVL